MIKENSKTSLVHLVSAEHRILSDKSVKKAYEKIENDDDEGIESESSSFGIGRDSNEQLFLKIFQKRDDNQFINQFLRDQLSLFKY